MNLGQVKTKARAAVKRREDEIEQEEIEGGEINLIPYLDIVTNLMLFLLASISAGLLMGQLNTTLPDRGPTQANMADRDPNANPNEKPLKMVVSVTRDKILVWSISGLEGTLKEPRAVIERSGQLGSECFADYQCELSFCSSETKTCAIRDAAAETEPIPVYNYQKLNQVLFDIAKQWWAGKTRALDTFKVVLMADGSVPYGTIVSVMDAMRCVLPEPGEAGGVCQLPSSNPVVKEAENPADPLLAPLYDPARKPYDPETDALFHDILFSTGFE